MTNSRRPASSKPPAAPDIAALVLDFDGLLMDTETPAFESWRIVYAEHGHTLTMELWAQALGTSSAFDAAGHLAELLGQQVPPVQVEAASLRARRTAIKQRLNEGLPLLPGVHSLLEQAQAMGLPCAIASSSDYAWVGGWLRQHGIAERFACVRTADDVAATKPAPDLFLSAAACLGIPPAACLVFEDSPNGILAAQAAGMRCVAVPGAISRQMTLPPADLLLPALDALPLREIVARVASGQQQ
jgi:HAD superfamily hydrolase (TIGR01509 family)